MKSRNRLFYFFILSALVATALGITPAPAAAAEPMVCLPSCSSTDGRMFTVASAGLRTLAGQSVFIKIAVSQSVASFNVGIFDGDTSGTWDMGSTPMVYTLFADPTNTQTGTEQVGQWMGNNMPDNDWTILTVDQNPRAQSPGGDYFYVLRAEMSNAATTTQVANSFKVRSTSPIELATNQSFAYMVPLTSTSSRAIIYPNYPTLEPTTNDGTWDMYLNVPTSESKFAIWDGDFDYGSYDCSLNDTDDQDTPNDVHPAWAAANSDVLEGVAVGVGSCKNSTGTTITGPEGQTTNTSSPTDDSLSKIYRRMPAVIYDVIDPSGNIYHNANPSGNTEWEQFIISSDAGIAADHYVTGLLPAGTYKIHITGLDLNNLNAWHSSYDAICVHEDGTPCTPVLHPYRIGDTVWADTNGNGVQDEGEAGIPGVTVTLLDSNGNVLLNGTTTTDENGNYSFGVDGGTYTVQVDASNFEAGGTLAGYSSTTSGGDIQTNTVTTDNVFTYDFGYRLPFSSLGDLVWEDANGNGIQDPGEAGIAGVTVNLLGGDGTTVVAATTTDAAGNYSFTGLMPGMYFVQILAPSEKVFTKVNAGSDDVKDSDVDASNGKTAAITLGAGETNTSVDAGLKPNVNYCSYIRSPGFWKNYSNHMSDAAFQSLLSHTQDFSYLTVSQARTILKTNNGTTKVGISQLDGVNASYLKFLLSAELNAAWNGQDNAAAPNGIVGNGNYQGTNMIVNQVLHQAYLDRYKFSSTQKGYLEYLGSDGENVNQDICLVQP